MRNDRRRRSSEKGVRTKKEMQVEEVVAAVFFLYWELYVLLMIFA